MAQWKEAAREVRSASEASRLRHELGVGLPRHPFHDIPLRSSVLHLNCLTIPFVCCFISDMLLPSRSSPRRQPPPRRTRNYAHDPCDISLADRRRCLCLWMRAGLFDGRLPACGRRECQANAAGRVPRSAHSKDRTLRKSSINHISPKSPIHNTPSTSPQGPEL